MLPSRTTRRHGPDGKAKKIHTQAQGPPRAEQAASQLLHVRSEHLKFLSDTRDDEKMADKILQMIVAMVMMSG